MFCYSDRFVNYNSPQGTQLFIKLLVTTSKISITKVLLAVFLILTS